MSNAERTTDSTQLSRIPFTLAAEKQIATLSFWLTVIGWLGGIAAGMIIVSLLLPSRNLGLLVDLIVYIAIATWSFQAARAFKNVATTDVADQAYLVEGFSKLRSIFLLQGVMILIGLAFLSAVLLFLLLHAVR
jgi:hypothetical protein